MINLLFWISSGCVAGIGIAAAYSGFWEIVVLAVAGIAINIKIMLALKLK